MSINLVIDEEKFGTDEFGRHTANYTNLVFSTISLDVCEKIKDLIWENDEYESLVIYSAENGNEFEVYGELIKQVVDLAKAEVNGKLDDDKQYRIEFDY